VPTSGATADSADAERYAQIDTLAVVETPEGIGLSLRPAGLVPRTMAFLLDLMIRLVIDLLIFMVAGLIPHMGKGVALIGAFGVEWLYPVIFELTRSGATPGKRSLGLRVVMDTGLPVTPAASFTRNLLRTADFLPLAYGFGILSLLLNRDCKRLGDLAAGTLVVHDKAVVLHDTPPRVESLAPARLLSMREQAAIRSWAGRAKRLTPARYEELAKLALSVLPPKSPGAPNSSPAERLLGVAQWLMGRRESSTAKSASKEPPR
jgi:uncharacterized RDD family membrane protein YckC